MKCVYACCAFLTNLSCLYPALRKRRYISMSSRFSLFLQSAGNIFVVLPLDVS